MQGHGNAKGYEAREENEWHLNYRQIGLEDIMKHEFKRKAWATRIRLRASWGARTALIHLAAHHLLSGRGTVQWWSAWVRRWGLTRVLS